MHSIAMFPLHGMAQLCSTRSSQKPPVACGSSWCERKVGHLGQMQRGHAVKKGEELKPHPVCSGWKRKTKSGAILSSLSWFKLKRVSPSQPHMKDGRRGAVAVVSAMEPTQCHVQAYYNTRLMPCQSNWDASEGPTTVIDASINSPLWPPELFIWNCN